MNTLSVSGKNWILKKYNQDYPNITTTTSWNDILENTNITAVRIALPAEMHYTIPKSA